MPPLKAVFFDCDNTLVMSEALAFEACADLSNELLEKHGVDKRYTGSELLETFVGQNFRGMMKGLQEKHDFKLDDDELESYVNTEVDRVVAKLSEKAENCDGAFEQVKALYDSKKYLMAVVSTSAKPRVVASLKKADMYQFFPDEWVLSAATTLDPPTSKPDPAIYNYALKLIGLKADEVCTIEDSKSGATAAMRAGIPLIGYLGPYYEESGPEKAKEMEKVLTEQCNATVIMHHWREFPDCLQKIIDS